MKDQIHELIVDLVQKGINIYWSQKKTAGTYQIYIDQTEYKFSTKQDVYNALTLIKNMNQ